MKRLGLVVPCYNEEEVIKTTNQKLVNLLENLIYKKKIKENSFILYVNDGSKDKTGIYIEEMHNENPKRIKGIQLSNNVGHQFALVAGLDYIKKHCDYSISIDADLQDDIKVIEDMVDNANNGYDIVYGVRKKRKKDSFFKRVTAESYYKFLKFLGVKTIYNHADFRLLNKKALKELCKYKEKNLYLRGIIPLLGFNTTSVYYERKERMAGVSKYPLSKMIKLAANGITSFSIKPATYVLYLGFISFLIAIGIGIYSLNSYLKGNAIVGWTSIILSIWFIGALCLIGLGIIGEYIGKIYIETKDRPRYHIEKILDKGNNKKKKSN